MRVKKLLNIVFNSLDKVDDNNFDEIKIYLERKEKN